MTRIIQALSEISGGYDVLFCDLWGCVHNGREAYPAAIAALQDFRRQGGRVALMTNAPRPRHLVAEQIARLRVPDDAWDDIVTSGDAAQEAMLAGDVGRDVWHIGTGKDAGFFEMPDPRASSIRRVAFEDAEGIVATGPFDEFNETPEHYREVLEQAQARGLKMLCANPDIVVDVGETRIYCAGALAQLYEELGGEALYFGKPHAPIYDLARKHLGLNGSERILCIGDGVVTDVEGGRQQGLDTLFITGGLAAADLGTDVENPDEGLLTGWLAEQGQAPAYAMGRLR
ncbi:TIGR01459 family HAD-type hydrolase [Paracoccus sp. Z118]|uniref:TIGR01459 family HAD-type hydrolase n=1 Tax=Paracoccus sp. Z118 TaxID=2851017 RepID=UPI001C2BF272|nr:TIGR01459 family HAD-type hydrolase [Paracoccus sp. Z118]MBV0892406.1 TIGR01459 family HAD-type hydrolase [Paracoccus sp. Z118]